MEALLVLLNLAILVVCAAGMECVAWFTHKYVMHGFLWKLHRDHHVPHRGHLEKNDIFVLIFATPAVITLMIGITWGVWPLISAGAGITLYGIGYVLFHDIMFHRRLRGLKLRPWNAYMRRIINAHRNHHKTAARRPGEAYGFLWAPRTYKVPDHPPRRPDA